MLQCQLSFWDKGMLKFPHQAEGFFPHRCSPGAHSSFS